MKEIWRIIKNFENYEVSNLGKVRNTIFKNNICEKKKNKILKNSDNGTGYLAVQLRKDGKKYVKYIHRLVAEAFIGDIKGMDVNHKDFNRKNNNVNNLEICTRLENIRYSIKGGKYKNIKKYNAKEKVKKIKLNIIEDFKSGMLKQEIYKKYKVDGRTLKKYGVILDKR